MEPGVGAALLALWMMVRFELVVGIGSQALLLEMWVVLGWVEVMAVTIGTARPKIKMRWLQMFDMLL